MTGTPVRVVAAERQEGDWLPPAAAEASPFVRARRHRTLRPFAWQVVALLLVTGALTLVLPIKAPVYLYDEGIALTNGLRVFNGEVPFRDYWSIYPPGQSYVLAGLFALFQPTLMVTRMYSTIVRLCLASVIFGLALAMFRRRWWAVLPYLCTLALFAGTAFYSYPIFPALLCAFTALLLACLSWRTGGQGWCFGAGLATGCCLLFRLDVGLYTALALTAGLIAQELSGRPRQRHPGSRRRRLAVAWLLSAAGTGIVAVPVYVLWILAGGASTLWNDLVVFPVTVLREVRHLPAPPLWPDWSDWRSVHTSLRFYFPIVVWGVTASVVLRAVRRTHPPRRRLRAHHAPAVALAVLHAGLFVQALNRHDWIHLLPVSLCTVLLLVWLTQQITPKAARRFPSRAAVTLALALTVWLYILSPARRATQQLAHFGPLGCYSQWSPAGCVPLFPGQESMLEALREVPPGPIYSGLVRHDRIFINDASLYFLSGRPAGTRYHELHPGVATTRPIQEEIIAELQRRAVQWLVLLDWPASREPNASAVSSGVTVLDDYIRAEYHPRHTAGMYHLWERNGLAHPADGLPTSTTRTP